MPKISVIVPAYNEEKFLARTLGTLKAQDYRDFELIVVDNNSRDNTNKIARKFADKVVVEKKKGYHNATSRGAKVAKAPVIAFCDADSLYPENWLSKIMRHFENVEAEHYRSQSSRAYARAKYDAECLREGGMTDFWR